MAEVRVKLGFCSVTLGFCPGFLAFPALAGTTGLPWPFALLECPLAARWSSVWARDCIADLLEIIKRWRTGRGLAAGSLLGRRPLAAEALFPFLFNIFNL